MISGSYPPMHDGIGDYTDKLFKHISLHSHIDAMLITADTSSSRDDASGRIVARFRKWNLRTVFTILKVLRRHQADLVHIQYPSAGYRRDPSINFLPFLVRLVVQKTKIVITLHEFSNRTIQGKLRLLMSMMPSHRIITVERGYRDEITRLCPFLKHKVVYIPVGSNIESARIPSGDVLTSLRLELDCEDRQVLVFFGIVKEGKGISFLLRAFDKLKTKMKNVRLVIVGHVNDDFFNDHIEAMCQRMRYPDSVTFTGSRPQETVSHMLRLADVCVLPFEDGVSTKRGSFVAALHHRKPIITTPPANFIKGLEDGKNVFFVPYGDTNKLAERIQILLSDEALRRSFRLNLEPLAKRHSWEHIAEKTVDVYQQVQKGS